MIPTTTTFKIKVNIFFVIMITKCPKAIQSLTKIYFLTESLQNMIWIKQVIYLLKGNKNLHKNLKSVNIINKHSKIIKIFKKILQKIK